MGLDIKAPDNVILKPIITVFGVGGAGGNAVNNMIKSNLKGANFVVANTDAQALKHSESENKIQLGAESTKGLGAGASPEVGHSAAVESESEIRSYLEGSNMLFVTAGMGGGTGTGASPVIAKIAKELGILTVGVVTKPFLFEGARRMKVANKGLAELQGYVDTLIVVPNQNLFRIANENTTFQEAFEMADDVLHAGVRGVTDLITSPGLVNLDFADIETVMREKGKAMMGTGEASGEDRAIKAAESAIANPLLDQNSMRGASGVLINITGGKDMTLYEVDSAANRIREEVGETDANIIFGSTFSSELEGTIRVSVVATGIDQVESLVIQSNKEAVEIVEEVEQPLAQSTSDQEELSELNNESNSSEEMPPSFQEYGSVDTNNQRISQEQFEELVQQKDWHKSDEVEEVVPTDDANRQKNKKSLIKRMWHSLIASEPHKDEEESKISDSYQLRQSLSQNEELSNIQDKPTFFNKDS